MVEDKGIKWWFMWRVWEDIGFSKGYSGVDDDIYDNVLIKVYGVVSE